MISFLPCARRRHTARDQHSTLTLSLALLCSLAGAFFKQTGTEKPLMEIMKEASAKNFMPLFRGTVPLMGHSLASAVLGLVGQPRLQKYVQKEIGQTGKLSGSATNLVASAVVSPIYVIVTNPLSRLEVIMQTNSIKGSSIGVIEAPQGEIATDMSTFGLAGVFRGQGIGIAKAIVSLTLFHEGRIWIGGKFKEYNKSKEPHPGEEVRVTTLRICTGGGGEQHDEEERRGRRDALRESDHTHTSSPLLGKGRRITHNPNFLIQRVLWEAGGGRGVRFSFWAGRVAGAMVSMAWCAYHPFEVR